MDTHIEKKTNGLDFLDSWTAPVKENNGIYKIISDEEEYKQKVKESTEFIEDEE